MKRYPSIISLFLLTAVILITGCAHTTKETEIDENKHDSKDTSKPSEKETSTEAEQMGVSSKDLEKEQRELQKKLKQLQHKKHALNKEAKTQMKEESASEPSEPEASSKKHDKTKNYELDDKEATGYLDNPTPIYILDAKDSKSSESESSPARPDESEASESPSKNSDRSSGVGGGSSGTDDLVGSLMEGEDLRDKPETSDRRGKEKLKKRSAKATPRHVRKSTGAKASQVKAASHNDNQEFPFYLDFCRENQGLTPYPWKISERYVIHVLDSDSTPLFNREVVIQDKKGKKVFSARSQAGGEVLLFPEMDLAPGYTSIEDYSLSVGNKQSKDIDPERDGSINILLPNHKKDYKIPPVQISFLIDATGSMGDEIQKLRDVIFSIHSRLESHPAKPEIEYSFVSYRDKKDAYLVRGKPFTSDIDTFQLNLESLKAGGGGDYPEDLEAGLQYTTDSLEWRDTALKFVFLMADAPPHLNKKQGNYLKYADILRRRGIMLTPIGASGLKRDGEFVFRQLGLLTNSEFVFLHYGERGESDGAATRSDPGKVSHHTGSNYNVRRLDDIVVDIISTQLGYLSPEDIVVREYPEPETESEKLDIRVASILRQIIGNSAIDSNESVVIAPISPSEPSLKEIADYVWNLSVEKFAELSTASVIERKRLEDVLAELELDMAGLTDSENRSSAVKLLDAESILLSEVQYLGSIRICHMRLVDIKTGKVRSAARVKL